MLIYGLLFSPSAPPGGQPCPLVHVEGMPRQQNGYDCGVYLLAAADHALFLASPQGSKCCCCALYLVPVGAYRPAHISAHAVSRRDTFPPCAFLQLRALADGMLHLLSNPSPTRTFRITRSRAYSERSVHCHTLPALFAWASLTAELQTGTCCCPHPLSHPPNHSTASHLMPFGVSACNQV